MVPERLATLLGGAIFASDPGTESEEFNRRYAVRADDPRFASAILDARMIGWILSLPSNTGFEILDGRLLCFVARRELGDVEHAMSTGERFLARAGCRAVDLRLGRSRRSARGRGSAAWVSGPPRRYSP